MQVRRLQSPHSCRHRVGTRSLHECPNCQNQEHCCCCMHSRAAGGRLRSVSMVQCLQQAADRLAHTRTNATVLRL